MNQELFNLFIVLLTVLFTYGGVSIYIRLNTYLEKKFSSEELKTVKSLASITVKYIENIYKTLNVNGNVKLKEAVNVLKDMLAKYDITLTDEELKIYIENAVNELNNKINETKKEG